MLSTYLRYKNKVWVTLIILGHQGNGCDSRRGEVVRRKGSEGYVGDPAEVKREKGTQGLGQVGQARTGYVRARMVINFDKKSAKIFIFFVKNAKIFACAFGARIIYFLFELQQPNLSKNNTIPTNVNDYTRKNDEFCVQQVKIKARQQKNRLKMH